MTTCTNQRGVSNRDCLFNIRQDGPVRPSEPGLGFDKTCFCWQLIWLLSDPGVWTSLFVERIEINGRGSFPNRMVCFCWSVKPVELDRLRLTEFVSPKCLTASVGFCQTRTCWDKQSLPGYSLTAGSYLTADMMHSAAVERLGSVLTQPVSSCSLVCCSSG